MDDLRNQILWQKYESAKKLKGTKTILLIIVHCKLI